VNGNKTKKIQLEQKNIRMFFETEEHVEPCCEVLCRTMQGQKNMCKKTSKTCARQKLDAGIWRLMVTISTPIQRANEKAQGALTRAFGGATIRTLLRHCISLILLICEGVVLSLIALPVPHSIVGFSRRCYHFWSRCICYWWTLVDLSCEWGWCKAPMQSWSLQAISCLPFHCLYV